MGEDLVSILMPMHNAEGFVREAIASCIAQTHERWELIVIDDASIDGSPDIVSDMADPRVILFPLPHNVGAGKARNIALEHAKGEWITVLDADDAYRHDRLSALVKHARSYGRQCVFLDQIDRTLKSTDPLSIQDLTPRSATRNLGRVTLAEWLTGPHVGQPFFHASGVRDRRVRYPATRAAEDTVFLVRLVQRNALAIVETPNLGYIYRRTPGSLSTPTLAMTRERERAYSELLAEFPEPENLRRAIRSLLDASRRRREWLVFRRNVEERRVFTASRMLATSPTLIAEGAQRSLRAAIRRLLRSR